MFRSFNTVVVVVGRSKKTNHLIQYVMNRVDFPPSLLQTNSNFPPNVHLVNVNIVKNEGLVSYIVLLFPAIERKPLATMNASEA